MNGRSILINIFRWFVLVIAQIFFLRNFVFYDLATPFLYCLFILILPFGIPNLLLFIIAFITGLTLDSFYDTLGVHTTACITLAFVRTSFISLTLSRESIDDPEPSLGNMGIKWFSLYAFLGVFFHHLVLFFLEAFKLSDIGHTLGRCIISVLLTLFTILLVEFTFHNRKSN